VTFEATFETTFEAVFEATFEGVGLEATIERLENIETGSKFKI